MKVWRLVITGNQNQLENPSLNKEKSEELSEQSQEQQASNQDSQSSQTSETNQQSSSQESVSNQSQSQEQQTNNQESQSSQSSQNSQQNSTQSQSQEENSNSSQTSNNTSSQQKSQSSQTSENNQQSSSQESVSNQSQSQEQQTSNQESQSSQSNQNSQQNSTQSQSQEENSNSSQSSNNTSSQQNSQSSQTSENNQQSNQESQSQEQNPNSSQSSNNTNPQQNPQSSQTSENNQQSNQESQSSNNNQSNEKLQQLMDKTQKQLSPKKLSNKEKKKKKREEKRKQQQEEGKDKKGRWSKEKPNRQNPKNDFQGIYRTQKQKIKEQKEKTLAARKEQQAKESVKEKKEQKKKKIDSNTQSIINQLQSLVPYDKRETGDGYGNLEAKDEKAPETLIRTLITKFLTQRFRVQKTDLNSRSKSSLDKVEGFHKWDVPQVAIHLKSKQYTKLLRDKYSYEYGKGKSDNIPLSFYFDLSGSMSEFNPILIILIKELLKNNIKVLVGYNNQIQCQIDSINPKIDDDTIISQIVSLGYGAANNKSGVKVTEIRNNLFYFLKEKRAEKCVIFYDYDPQEDITGLSKIAQVYWFCFENTWCKNAVTEAFDGFYYKVEDLDDIYLGLREINSKRFETLCYLSKKQKVKRRD